MHDIAYPALKPMKFLSPSLFGGRQYQKIIGLQSVVKTYQVIRHIQTHCFRYSSHYKRTIPNNKKNKKVGKKKI